MAHHLRLSEKWFNRGLWLIAVLFAYFLIGLGGAVVGDLPRIESRLSPDDFVDRAAKDRLTQQIKTLAQEETAVNERLEQTKLLLQTAQADHQSARQAFDAWVTTRQATQRADQDREVIERTTQLEQLRKKERDQLAAMEAIEKKLLDVAQSKAQANRALADVEEAAAAQFESGQKAIELRVFIYRLAFVLPLLGVSIYLFVKHRRQTYWPFVWGFIFFSAFAFFVALVPYLPSYGGYVRYTVGVVVTLVAGRYAIAALQRYIEQQRALEHQPDAQRKHDIDYDLALTRIGKGICPSCERPITAATDNFCQHCGIEVFDACPACGTRKIAFSKFCFHCGQKADKVPTEPAS